MSNKSEEKAERFSNSGKADYPSDHNEAAKKEEEAEKKGSEVASNQAGEFKVPCFGGVKGNGSDFEMSEEEYTKLQKQEEKYREIGQKILGLADININGTRPWDMKINNPLIYRRVIQKGTLGLGEGFMEGWWDSNDFFALDQFFSQALTGGIEYYFPNNAKDTMNILKAKLFNPQTKSKSKKVGLQHYDIGNTFFENMLGKYMQYSCAYWEKTVVGEEEEEDEKASKEEVVTKTTPPKRKSCIPGTRIVQVKTLEEAQMIKLKMIGDKLNLTPRNGNDQDDAEHPLLEVLDVGCGWGGLALFLAEHYYVKVTGITISEEQKKMAQERTQHNGNITILNQDYRDMKFERKFNRIVSVGMFEHVGPKNYKTYFKHIHRLIDETDEEAVFLLHTIGSKTTMDSADQWYLKYIFPGGCLPSISNFGKSIEGLFVVEDLHNFGYFYGKTLLAWRENFLNYWMTNPPERQREDGSMFFRTFYYFLSSSAGAFLCRDLQLWQTVLSVKGLKGYPHSVRP
ncbi:Mycolic acid cyclopropane synthetase/Methyltransferase domain/Nodulation protein S (NodS)/Methyltransferase small domain containing protein, putative [Angomonas deanei]|uniref:Mycolic acid cyclopropane synthetase/Methyltransferase domain/Nodulation protein S (NodS)/Methyltransferase small domain containing protein, putative n=1 Tax=Angomonas deanei TaxID=59799 RepID=A0A7G2CBB2_9TRYP|nr:Mycolic acid cyclopropane synthetase/Methyltransferase domain/Nodulation protein S (NodS)/Methyltransferase small domain containing protein, putative [Angomonas deanei]